MTTKFGVRIVFKNAQIKCVPTFIGLPQQLHCFEDGEGGSTSPQSQKTKNFGGTIIYN